jgi:hypothetical protein
LDAISGRTPPLAMAITDENGKRRVTSWLMTEAAVRELRTRLQGRGKDRRLAGSQEDIGLDKRRSAVAAEVIAGRRVKVSWEAPQVRTLRRFRPNSPTDSGKPIGTARCLTQLPALLALAIGGVFPTPIAALLALAMCRVPAAP